MHNFNSFWFPFLFPFGFPFEFFFGFPFVPPPPSNCSGFYYRVQPGESLYSISLKFGVSLSALEAANPQVLPPNFVIYPGQILCIPRTGVQIPPPPATCSGFYYVVRQGDTLFLIAQRYGVTLAAIQTANPQILPPNFTIFPGQVICVPRAVGNFPPPPATCSGFYYVVQRGDSLFLIAQRYGVTLAAIQAANPQITGPNFYIFPGQIICVPRPLGSVPPPPATCSGFYYVVELGDSLFSIAQKFGRSLSSLQAANPQITGPNYVIYPGQVICIPRA